MICSKVPAPNRIAVDRANKLFSNFHGEDSISKELVTRALCEGGSAAPTSADSEAGTAPTVVGFVSKMVCISADQLPQKKSTTLTMEETLARRAKLIAQRKATGRDVAPAAAVSNKDMLTDGPVPTKPAQDDGAPLQEDGSCVLPLQPASDSGAGVAVVPGPPTVATGATASETNDSAETGSNKEDEKEDEPTSVMIAYTRIFVGTLRVGQKVHVLGAKYKASEPDKHVASATIERMFILMGRQLVLVDEAPPGSIVGIIGLDQHVLKTATISTTLACPSLARAGMHSKPICRVVLDAVSIVDMPKLKQGMKLLYQADPCVEVLIQGSGEHILVSAGEVHLERCVSDLRERFCPGIEFTVSKPIVPLRETIVVPPTVDMRQEAIGEANVSDAALARSHYLLDGASEAVGGEVVTITTNKHVRIKIRARPLPTKVIEILLKHDADIQSILDSKRRRGSTVEAAATNTASEGGSPRGVRFSPEAELYTKLSTAFDKEGKDWQDAAKKIWCFGPRQVGPNMLFNCSGMASITPFFAGSFPAEQATDSGTVASWVNSINVAFDLTTQNGPLAQEPMSGVAFDVVEIAVQDEGSADDFMFSGQIIKAAKDAFVGAFLAQPVRLMTAFYKCDLLVSAAGLGKVYGVLNRRNSKILSEEMKEGTDSFIINALVPVTHSFGFAEEIRRKSSGLASPQLIFSHWAIIHDDPFWVPHTEEELEHYGEKSDAPNPARDLLDDVRKRKGLRVEEKIVEFAEKQRTLGRNK